MSIGFNSKLQLSGGQYDVQTEDRGPAHPFIDTVVLSAGQVLHRRSTSYSDLLVNGPADPAVLRSRSERQHLEVLEALRSGTLPLQEPAQQAIQVRLLNAASWLTNGKVKLEIEVSTRSDDHPVPEAEVQATIEDGGETQAVSAGKSDAQGRLRLEFAFPKLTNPSLAALVISARAGGRQNQLRYSLKPTSGASAPRTP